MSSQWLVTSDFVWQEITNLMRQINFMFMFLHVYFLGPIYQYSEVRLAGGSTSAEGRVEVNHNGEWRPICNDGWGVTEGTTICNQLGFR